MGIQSLDSHTIMFGVFGDPIRHSKSPIMMNIAFQEMNLNAVYTAYHILPHQLKNAVEGIKALQFGGVNVTIPHKVEVMNYLDEIDEGARIVGAVNTLVNEAGKWIGYNTDGIGYVRSLKEETKLTLKGKNILVIGAGGAARGVVYALAKEEPSTIWIANRTESKAVSLAKSMSLFAEVHGMGMDKINDIQKKVDVVVNTTAVGMFPNIDEMPLDPSWFHEGMVVSDLIYNPKITKFLKHARNQGSQIHGGLGMFIYQGAYAFEYWTGQSAPVDQMRKRVEQAL